MSERDFKEKSQQIAEVKKAIEAFPETEISQIRETKKSNLSA
jgi:hypothetical protein